MNLDKMKTEWQQLNQRLAASQKLNEQLIITMLRERSRSRVDTVRRTNTVYLLLMILNLAAMAAIFISNPFDFKYILQYLPYGFLTIGVLMAIGSLYKSFRSFTIAINTMSLDVFLKKVIHQYEKNKRAESWFGRIILTAGVITAFSFLPNKLERKELWLALTETALSMIITLAIYYVAFKLGAFKNRNKEGFENDLKEWKKLKRLADELEY